MRKPTFWFPTWSDTNQAVRLQKIVEGLDYLFSQNKGADQLRGYREADLRLCFAHMQHVGFLMNGSLYVLKVLEIPRKRWLRPNMTEKLLTGTLSLNTNKQNNKDQIYELFFFIFIFILSLLFFVPVIYLLNIMAF